MFKKDNTLRRGRSQQSSSANLHEIAITLTSTRVVAAQFMASLLLHYPGLAMLMKYDGTPNVMVKAFLGAGLEGVLVLSIVHLLCAQRRPLPIILALFLVGSSSFCMFGDFWFQMKTQGALPDMWTIVGGFRDPKTYLQDEFNDDSALLMAELVSNLQNHLVAGCMLLGSTRILRKSKKQTIDSARIDPKIRLVQFYATLFILIVILYVLNFWMPIIHVYFSIMGSSILQPHGYSSNLQDALTVKIRADNINFDSPRFDKLPNAPNLVVILHDSLSNEALTSTHDYNTPFYQKMAKSKTDFYMFENVRSASGDTADGLTVIESGCMPLNGGEGMEMALNTTIATRFKEAGYDTVSFTTFPITGLKGTKWFMNYNHFTANFAKVFPPIQDDQHDGVTAKFFEKWIRERQTHAASKLPFFAQFYFMDSHYPFYNDPAVSNTSERIPGMFATVDNTIEFIFNTLNQTGQLENTVVMGVADHGENLLNAKTKDDRTPRISSPWTSSVLNPALYMYIPKKMPDKTKVSTILRHNTKQLVSANDVYPTLMHLLPEREQQAWPLTDKNCIRGHNLFNTRIQTDRIAWSLTGVSRELHKAEKGDLALHTGIRSSLCYRWKWKKYNGLQVVEYGTSAYAPKRRKDKAILDLSAWRSIVLNLTGTENEAVFHAMPQIMEGFLEELNIGWNNKMIDEESSN